jgi:hypothetical protein
MQPRSRHPCDPPPVSFSWLDGEIAADLTRRRGGALVWVSCVTLAAGGVLNLLLATLFAG